MPEQEEQDIDALIGSVQETLEWSNEVLAAKLRERGVVCSTSSIYNWSRGKPPHPNTERLLRVQIKKFLSNASADA